MIILSHRGCWNSIEERNKHIAFERSFEKGFGTETDIRDLSGTLVISHDPPTGFEMSFTEFLEIYKKYDNLPLALNIKSDGLQAMLKKSLEEYNITNYFVFDMSVPDALLYIETDFNTYTRQSEYEKEPSLYKESDGVWIDCFVNNWIEEDILINHINANKKVCLVSPDLHKRDYLFFWKKLKESSIIASDNLFLCTDYPEEARSFFRMEG